MACDALQVVPCVCCLRHAAPPSALPEACETCPQFSGPSRGAGDMVAKALHSVGFDPCGGCRKRQAWLNRVLPSRPYQERLRDGESGIAKGG